MMSDTYELTGYIEEATGKVPFYLKISAPVLTDDGDDYYCSVHMPYFLKSDKDIFGVDEGQAKELAIGFVKSMLGERSLVDESGKVIEF